MANADRAHPRQPRTVHRLCITGAEQSPHLCLLPINAGNWQTATGANQTPVQRHTGADNKPLLFSRSCGLEPIFSQVQLAIISMADACITHRLQSQNAPHVARIASLQPHELAEFYDKRRNCKKNKQIIKYIFYNNNTHLTHGGYVPVRIKFPDFSRYIMLHLCSCTDPCRDIDTNRNTKAPLTQLCWSTYWKERHIM